MDPFPEATGRETTDEESVDEPEPDDVTETSPDTGNDETTRTSEEGHVCDPDSPVPCQFH